MIDLGNNQTKYYQFFLVIVGAIFSSSMFWYYSLNQTQNCLIILIFMLLFFSIFISYYLRFHRVRVDRDFFYIENIFRRIRISKDEFLKIQVISTKPYVLRITFTGERRYLFNLNSSDSFKGMFFDNIKEVEEQILRKIKHTQSS